MFDNAIPIPHTQSGQVPGSNSVHDEFALAPLRTMDWQELTARLSAARDVRDVLRRDANRSIVASAHSFADAAARYFRTKEEGERDVNPVALEHGKGSPGIVPVHQGLEDIETQKPGLAESGDARED